MHKFLLTAAGGVLALALTGAGALAGPPKGQQVVAGTVQFMAPAHTGGCFFGITRNLAILFGEEAHQGRWGFIVDVDESTWGKPFTLKPNSATLPADLDLAFYSELGAAYPAASPATSAFETRAAGGEKGKVPADMTKAIVCMHDGYEADFVYKAGKPAPKHHHHH